MEKATQICELWQQNLSGATSGNVESDATGAVPASSPEFGMWEVLSFPITPINGVVLTDLVGKHLATFEDVFPSTRNPALLSACC